MTKIIKKHWYILIVICLFLILVYLNNKPKEDNKIVIEDDNIEKTIEQIGETNVFYVDIKGEVNNPGVYQVSSNTRVIDVINSSGGLTDNADTSLINLSKKVTDEMNIIIYSKDDIEEAKERLNPTIIEVIKEVEASCICPNDDDCDNVNDALIEVIDDLVNINTATKEELMTLPKIGESKADNIIEYRKTNKFNTIDDIKNVSGIGDSLFENIKDYICV